MTIFLIAPRNYSVVRMLLQNLLARWLSLLFLMVFTIFCRPSMCESLSMSGSLIPSSLNQSSLSIQNTALIRFRALLKISPWNWDTVNLKSQSSSRMYLMRSDIFLSIFCTIITSSWSEGISAFWLVQYQKVSLLHSRFLMVDSPKVSSSLSDSVGISYVSCSIGLDTKLFRGGRWLLVLFGGEQGGVGWGLVDVFCLFRQQFSSKISSTSQIGMKPSLKCSSMSSIYSARSPSSFPTRVLISFTTSLSVRWNLNSSKSSLVFLSAFSCVCLICFSARFLMKRKNTRSSQLYSSFKNLSKITRFLAFLSMWLTKEWIRLIRLNWALFLILYFCSQYSVMKEAKTLSISMVSLNLRVLRMVLFLMKLAQYISQITLSS